MNKIKTILLTLTLLFSGTISMAPASVAALAPTQFGASLKSDACAGLTEVSASQDCNNEGAGLKGTVASVVNILSFFVGVAAIIMVIVSGLRFATAGGDANRVSGARNTLVYALIGVAIAALAQVLVHFVLNASSGGK